MVSLSKKMKQGLWLLWALLLLIMLLMCGEWDNTDYQALCAEGKIQTANTSTHRLRFELHCPLPESAR